MQCDAQVGEEKSLAGAGREFSHVVGQLEAPGDDGFRVVIAAQQETGAIETAHLLGEEQAGGEVLPISVVQVAGDHDEGRVLLQREVDHAGEGAAGAVADNVVRQIVTRPQPSEWAVEVDVGRVDKLHAGRLGWGAAVVTAGRGREPDKAVLTVAQLVLSVTSEQIELEHRISRVV